MGLDGPAPLCITTRDTTVPRGPRCRPRRHSRRARLPGHRIPPRIQFVDWRRVRARLLAAEHRRGRRPRALLLGAVQGVEQQLHGDCDTRRHAEGSRA